MFFYHLRKNICWFSLLPAFFKCFLKYLGLYFLYLNTSHPFVCLYIIRPFDPLPSLFWNLSTNVSIKSDHSFGFRLVLLPLHSLFSLWSLLFLLNVFGLIILSSFLLVPLSLFPLCYFRAVYLPLPGTGFKVFCYVFFCPFTRVFLVTRGAMALNVYTMMTGYAWRGINID